MCSVFAGDCSGGVAKAEHLKRKIDVLFPLGPFNSHSLCCGLLSFVVLADDSDLCGLWTRGSRVSSLLLDSCDIPDRLDDDINSFGRFPSSFPVEMVFIWASMIYQQSVGRLNFIELPAK